MRHQSASPKLLIIPLIPAKSQNSNFGRKWPNIISEYHSVRHSKTNCFYCFRANLSHFNVPALECLKKPEIRL